MVRVFVSQVMSGMVAQKIVENCSAGFGEYMANPMNGIQSQS